jgi:N-acetylglucosaminyl-diphospho-decaprenol L-rhamnosyltransferase
VTVAGDRPGRGRAAGTRHASIRAVVVSWNGEHLLRSCLDALAAQTVGPDELEIVVVDNASTDDTLTVLKREYPDVFVVRSTTNVGFAGGANLGLRGFEGDFVALVNNDATLEPDALAQMRATLEAPGAGRVAAATARILLAGTYRPAPVMSAQGVLTAGRAAYEPTGSDAEPGVRLVNSTGNVVHRNGTGGDRSWLEREDVEHDAPDVFGFCGGASLLRRSALDDVGVFDPTLFLYYEDTDLSWRLQSRGWHVRYVASAGATHIHAASSNSSSPLFRYYNTRNSLIVFTRHAPAEVVVRSVVRQFLGLARSAVRDPADDLTRARGRALRDYLAAAPKALRDRRRLWSRATVSRRAVAARMT